MPSDFMTIDRRKLDILARKGSAIKVQQVTFRTAEVAAGLAPGHMKEAIRPIFRGSAANPVGIVMVDHPAATYVLYGTQPHDIRPKTKKVLRFKMGGLVVYAKVVHHPGTKENNFLLKALMASRIA